MLSSTATLNSISLGALGAIVPTSISRIHLQRPQLVAPWSSTPQHLLRPKFIPNTTTTTVSGRSWEETISVVGVDSSSPAEKTITKFYFLVSNAKFLLDEEEHFQEQLFERLRLYGKRNKDHDFWVVIEPKFLDKFPNMTKRLKRPAVALVSTNGTWITFMKLRLDRVVLESYEADSLEEALASTPVNLEFKKPEKWMAPYPKYESGWWEPFLPPGSSKQDT